MVSQSRCGACGAPAPIPYRAPTAELAPDLDMRPGEPTRSTLGRWIVTCTHCGACAPDLAQVPATARAVIDTPGYHAPDGPPDAASFVRWSLICQHAGDPAEAAEARLQAAWAADDAQDAGAAAALRRDAARLWGRPEDLQTRLRLIDVLRRTGDFAAAADAAGALGAEPLDEVSARIVAYQQARITACDSDRHLISSALRPPAHSPHVAHGRRPAARGFWGRLLGR